MLRCSRLVSNKPISSSHTVRSSLDGILAAARLSRHRNDDLINDPLDVNNDEDDDEFSIFLI